MSNPFQTATSQPSLPMPTISNQNLLELNVSWIDPRFRLLHLESPTNTMPRERKAKLILIYERSAAVVVRSPVSEIYRILVDILHALPFTHTLPHNQALSSKDRSQSVCEKFRAGGGPRAARNFSTAGTRVEIARFMVTFVRFRATNDMVETPTSSRANVWLK